MADGFVLRLMDDVTMANDNGGTLDRIVRCVLFCCCCVNSGCGDLEIMVAQKSSVKYSTNPYEDAEFTIRLDLAEEQGTPMTRRTFSVAVERRHYSDS